MKRWDKNSRFVTLADQGLNSISNFVAVVLIANVASAELFGHFTVAYAALIFALGSQRALIGETLLVNHSKTSDVQSLIRPVLSASLIVGVISLVLLGLASLVMPPGARGLWIIMAVGALPILLQDVLRFLAIVARRPFDALVIDVIWTLPSIAGMAIGAFFKLSADFVLIVWILGAVLSLSFGLLKLGVFPSAKGGVLWLWTHRSSAGRFFAEFAALQGSNFLVLILLVPALGIAGVGALRGAQLLFSPLNTAFTSVRLAMIPELVRTRGTSVFRTRAFETIFAISIIAIVWCAVVLALQPSVGDLILGETWNKAADLRFAIAIQFLSMAGYTILLAFFRSIPLHYASSVMRGVLAVTTLVCAVGFSLLWGTEGAAWGFATAVAVSAAVGLTVYLDAQRRRQREAA